MIFDRHTKSVFCSKPSPNGDLIASGGEDDRGFVFDRMGELYMALFGHKGNLMGQIVNRWLPTRVQFINSFDFGTKQSDLLSKN